MPSLIHCTQKLLAEISDDLVRVLGSMNDIRFQIEVEVAHADGLANIELADLHQRLNRTPFSAIAYRHPVEGLRDFLAH